MDAYISSAISPDFRNVIPNTPEKAFAFPGFFPTDLSLTDVRMSIQISPRTEIYFNVISSVKMNNDGIRKVRILPVSLFHDVPADRIPTNVTDTYTLAVIFASVCGFPIKTAGKRSNTEIRTAPAVPLKT